MKVNSSKSFPHPDLPNHYIQLGISTWTEHLPLNEQEHSIRRAVYNSQGIFSPHGSSEVPIEDMGLLFSTCIQHDTIGNKELVSIIYKAIKSIFRQLF